MNGDTVTGQIEMDEDVRGVVQFMQANIRTSKLVGVANSLSGLAPLLWGHHPQEELLPLKFREGTISFEPRKQLAATE